jgi:inner membrane protein
MDTLTHALSGALLARLICARGVPAAAAAPALEPLPGRFSAPWDDRPGRMAPWQAALVGAAAAAFPDLDFVAQVAGDFFYLRHHRGVTHSVLLAPLWALLIAALMARWFEVTRASRGGWKSLYLLALAGLWLHIAGDWITQFGTMLLAPLSDRRFGLGAVFIIDLVLTGTLVVGLVLSAIFVRRRWPAALGLAAACGWVFVCWTGKQEAEAAALAHASRAGIRPVWIDSMPRPASPFNWTLAIFDGESYHLADVNTRRREPLEVGPEDFFVRRLSAPYLPAAQARWEQRARFGGPQAPDWAREAWNHEALATLRWFAGVPALVQWFERDGAAGGRERCAVYGDLRYSFPGRAQRPFTYALCLAPGATGTGGKVTLWRAGTETWAPL